MEIYVPYRVSQLPFINKAVELLDEYNETYNSEEDNSRDPEIDLVRNFVTLFYDSNENMTQDDRDAVVDYISQNFYFVKGTPMVCSLLKNYGYLSPNSTYEYTGKILKIKLENDGEFSYLYGTDVFLSRFKDFLEALLYFENCEIVVNKKEVRIKYDKEQGEIKYDVDLYVIDNINPIEL